MDQSDDKGAAAGMRPLLAQYVTVKQVESTIMRTLSAVWFVFIAYYCFVHFGAFAGFGIGLIVSAGAVMYAHDARKAFRAWRRRPVGPEIERVP